jgi:DNA-binding response OmpR family regulator
VLIVSDDPVLLIATAEKLRAIGCCVLCAPDLDQAAALARAQRMTTLIVVKLGGRACSSGELRRELWRRLPGWEVESEVAEPQVATAARDRGRLPN